MNAKRFVVTGKKQGEIQPFQAPASPAPGELLLRISHSLISPGTELHIYDSGAGSQGGFTPGYTAVGEISDVGSSADTARFGEKVFLFPGDADQRHCHATHKMVSADALTIPLPEGLSPDRATFARMINVALTPYCHVNAKLRQSVLVVGLGLVGNMAVQIGKRRGLTVIGLDPDPARRTRAEQVGIDAALDPVALGHEQTVKEVRQLTNSHGAELTINATGRASTFLTAIEATATGGELSTLGGARGETDVSLAAFLSQVQTRHITIRGGWEMLIPRRTAPSLTSPSTEQNLRLALDWLADGSINLDPVWTHTIAPEQIVETYHALATCHPDYLGVVVDWTR